ncbi:hypothetical protein KNE206_38350 [Kitasatospora sp. NE20-6]|uniref:hypothetical protein n=1 Tax=Kitasatospora sp. NE20-6 TaxID=2859066 RepID=UPI0034DC9CE8
MARPMSTDPSPLPDACPSPPAVTDERPGGLAVVVLDAAAASRPAHEVAELLHLLAGHTFPGADTAVRAAAVLRPVAEVAELVAALDADGPAVDLVTTEAVLRRPVGEVVQLAGLLARSAPDPLGRALARAALLRPVAEVAEMARALPSNGPRPETAPVEAPFPSEAEAKPFLGRALRWSTAAARG